MRPLMHPTCNCNIKVNIWEKADPLAWSARLSGIRSKFSEMAGESLDVNHGVRRYFNFSGEKE